MCTVLRGTISKFMNDREAEGMTLQRLEIND